MSTEENSAGRETACVLVIGGLDPSGGAGIPADARAISAFGAHACCVATAVIAQNTQGVARVKAVMPKMLRAQLSCLLEDIEPRAVKIGMLPNAQSAQIVAQTIRRMEVPVVLDTVFAPSSGPLFSDRETVEFIAHNLLRHCALITPNIGEAETLCGFTIKDIQAMKDAAQQIRNVYGAQGVLIKGGHLNGDEAVDVLLYGDAMSELRAPRIAGIEVRGTGCLLASAIAAQLAQDVLITDAVRAAKTWLTEKIETAKVLGQGRRIAV